MRRRSLLAALLGTPAVALAGPARLPVVASFSVLADMAREVGGDRVEVLSLVPPDGDVHGYEPRPSDLRALAPARLLVVNGMGLEGWMDRLARAAGYAGPVAVASSGVVPRQLNGRQLDPHAWQDARNGALYARAIGEGLAAAEPEAAEAHRAAGARYAAQIEEADGWIERTLAPVPPARRRIITSHDAFGYYGARYGIEFLAAQGIDADSEPSARGIARLADQIRRERIRAVFLENMTNPSYIRALAGDAGAVVGPPVYSDALSPPGGPAATYLAMLRWNTTQFAGAMLRT